MLQINLSPNVVSASVRLQHSHTRTRKRVCITFFPVEQVYIDHRVGNFACFVRKEGVEPSRPFGHQSLKLACLPNFSISAWTRIRDFHHIFSGVIQISLLPPSPTQGGASNISANSRGGASWSRTTFSGFSVRRIHHVCQSSINLTENAINPSHLGYLDSPPRRACFSSLH